MIKHLFISFRNLDTSFEIFSRPYSFVFCKSLKKYITLTGNLLTLLHTKVFNMFVKVVCSESNAQFFPVFEFGHSTQIRIFCCSNCPITCKANSSFSNRSLVTTLTPGVTGLQLLWWLSSRCAAIIIRYKPMFSLTTAL